MASESYILSAFWKKLNEAPNWDAPVAMNRNLAIPLDKYSVFDALSSAKEYAENGPNAYPGQIITVVDNETSAVTTYKIKVGGRLKQIDDVDISILTSSISSISSTLTSDISGISSLLTTDISSISSTLTNEIQFVSSDTSSKIWIEDRISGTISSHSNLSVIKLSEDEYVALYPNYDPNTLFVVESDKLNAYDARVINVADGEEDSDAVNYGQLTSIESNLTSDISGVSSLLTSNISSISSTLTTNISSISSTLTSEIQFVSADTSSKIWIEDKISNLISGHSNLSVVKLSEEEYCNLYPNYDINTLYVVESDNLNAYDAKIINVLAGSENSDAVNFEQLTTVSSLISRVYIKNTADDPQLSGVYTNLSVVKINKEEYDSIPKSELNPRTLYVLCSDYHDAYGKQIKYVEDGTDLLDAVNVGQLNKVSTFITQNVNDNIWIKNEEDGVPGQYSNLSVIKINKQEYDSTATSALSPRTIYVLCADYVDAYGKQIRNVSDGTNIYDAVNVKQLSSVKNSINEKINERIFDVSSDTMVKIQDLKQDLEDELECGVQLCVGTDVSVFTNGKNDGDIAVLSTQITNTGKYQVTGYVWKKDISAWSAMDGNYDARNVYFDANIELNGTYDKVGNIIRDSSHTTLSCKGKSLKDVFIDIFDTTVDPIDGNQPKVVLSKKVNGTNTTNFEVGTQVNVALTASFTHGDYYCPWNDTSTDDGTKPTHYWIKDSLGNKYDEASTNTAYTQTIPSFYISATYTANVSADYGNGDYAVNNKGQSISLRHLSGQAVHSTTVTCYRNTFWYKGPEGTIDEISATTIRSGTVAGSGEKKTYAITFTDNPKIVCYAIPGNHSLTSVKNPNNSEIKSIFEKTTMQIGGVENRFPTLYTVFYAISPGFGWEPSTWSLTAN